MSKTITTAILLFLLCGVAVCKGQSTVQVARASVSAFEQETFVTLANDTTSASPVNVKIMPRSANDGPVIEQLFSQQLNPFPETTNILPKFIFYIKIQATFSRVAPNSEMKRNYYI